MRNYDTDNPDDLAALMRLHPPESRFEFKKLSMYGSGRADRKRLIPIEAVPDQLVPKDSFKDVIEHCHKEKIFPMYHARATWPPEGTASDQDGLGYCWTW